MLYSTGEILLPAADRWGNRGVLPNPRRIAQLGNKVHVVCPPAKYARIGDLEVKGCSCETASPPYSAAINIPEKPAQAYVR